MFVSTRGECVCMCESNPLFVQLFLLIEPGLVNFILSHIYWVIRWLWGPIDGDGNAFCCCFSLHFFVCRYIPLLRRCSQSWKYAKFRIRPKFVFQENHLDFCAGEQFGVKDTARHRFTSRTKKTHVPRHQYTFFCSDNLFFWVELQFVR